MVIDNIIDLNKIKNEIPKRIYNYMKNCILSEYTNEFIFLNNPMAADIIYKKFVYPLDKRFYIRPHQISGINRYCNQSILLPIDKYTFCYFACGNKTPEKFYQDNRNDDNNKHSLADVYLCIFGKNREKYVKYIEKINEYVNKKKASIRYNKSVCIYSSAIDDGNNNELYFTCSKLSNRNPDTIYFSNNEDKITYEFIDNFIKKYEMYKSKQLNYKTGLLFYGEPGTGKSTFIKILANKYNRNILQINIGDIEYINFNELSSILNNDPNKYIVLFEDIDTLYLNRDKGENKFNNVINKLLQFLDSNSSPNNVIFIATTNYVGRLDDALLREGRFDLKLEFKPLNYKDTIKFGKSFGLSEPEVIDCIKEADKRNENKKGSKSGEYNQSLMQTLFIMKLKDSEISK